MAIIPRIGTNGWKSTLSQNTQVYYGPGEQYKSFFEGQINLPSRANSQNRWNLRILNGSCHMIIATVNAITAEKRLLAKLTMSLSIH